MSAAILSRTSARLAGAVDSTPWAALERRDIRPIQVMRRMSRVGQGCALWSRSQLLERDSSAARVGGSGESRQRITRLESYRAPTVRSRSQRARPPAMGQVAAQARAD
jgi:hypothetical protein